MIRQLLPWSRPRATKPDATISAHVSALGFRVGDGPLRFSDSSGRFSDRDYYVVAVYENRLILKPRRFNRIRRLIARLRFWWTTR